ncbi:unnamed protein product [Urochloa decumbens]|uniref:HTH 3-helical bundle domain-containing protein n=1 Tax=Urochloa decumbens TaxID=240449 RepID=A0ABC9FHP1_9POAL
MNPGSKGDWSASEIMVMKSLIAGPNTTTNNTDVVEELHALFPRKEKRQITDWTPVQVSNHAQKYFSKRQNTSSMQRYGINDVGLNDIEPLALNNALGTCMHGGLTFSEGSFIPDERNLASQLASMNNLSHVQSALFFRTSQATTGSIQEDAFAGSQQQLIGDSSTSAVPVIQGVGCQMPWNSNQLDDYLADEWICNMDMN